MRSVPLLASGGCQQSLAFFGLQLCNSSFCFRLHMALAVRLHLPLVIEFRTHQAVQDDFILKCVIQSICKDPFSKQGHDARTCFWRSTIQPTFTLHPASCLSYLHSQEQALRARHHKGSGKPYFSAASSLQHQGILSMLGNALCSTVRVARANCWAGISDPTAIFSSLSHAKQGACTPIGHVMSSISVQLTLPNHWRKFHQAQT